MTTQLTFTQTESDWTPPTEYPDLTNRSVIAIDLETRDDAITNKLGAGWATGQGEEIGFAVAVEGWQAYYPFNHLGGGNMIYEQVIKYMHDVCEYIGIKKSCDLSMNHKFKTTINEQLVFEDTDTIKFINEGISIIEDNTKRDLSAWKMII